MKPRQRDMGAAGAVAAVDCGSGDDANLVTRLSARVTGVPMNW